MRSAQSSLVRKSLWLLAGRVVQAVLGAFTLFLTVRSLGVSGFGNFAAAVAAAGIISGSLGAAFSDSVVTYRRAVTHVMPCLTALVGLLLAGFGVVSRSTDLTLVAAAASLFALLTVGSANRQGGARLDGKAYRLAAMQGLGSALTCAAAAGLYLVGSTTPALFILSYALQPAAMFLLPRGGGDEGDDGLRGTWNRTRPFIAGQVGWVVPANATILLVRIIDGPASAGSYASVVRLLDVMGILVPLLGTFALPMMRDIWTRSASLASRRLLGDLNLLVAALAAAALWLCIPFVWRVWPVLYPGSELPMTMFTVLAAAYSASVAWGLPDRVMQATDRSEAVGRMSLAVGAVTVLAAVPMIAVVGATGAAVVRLAADLTLNYGLARQSVLLPSYVGRHLVFTVALLLACLALPYTADSMVRSVVLSTAAVSAALVAVVTSTARSRRALVLEARSLAG